MRPGTAASRDDDPYASRCVDRWEAAPRRDPVVWGDGPGPLDQEQIAHYRERGFLLLPGLLLRREVEALAVEARRLLEQHAGSEAPDVISEPDSDVVRSIFRIHRKSPAMRDLVCDSRLAGAARQILHSDVYIHQSRINFKPALDGREFFWHSDFETWHIEDGMPRMRALSASVLLTENTEHNGPLMLVPGSHRLYIRCVGETPAEHHKQSLKKQECGVPSREALAHLVELGGLTSVKGPAGSVVFFDCNTMHASAGNLSPFPRTNLFFVYNSVDNPLTAPYGGLPPRPPFIGEPEPIPVGAP